jgi:hypothetical protein
MLLEERKKVEMKWEKKNHKRKSGTGNDAKRGIMKNDCR